MITTQIRNHHHMRALRNFSVAERGMRLPVPPFGDGPPAYRVDLPATRH
jgi:hypothetical protein